MFRSITIVGNSLAVQWLGLRAFTAKGWVSIPGQGTKIPQAAHCSQKKKKKSITIVTVSKSHLRPAGNLVA